MTTTNAKPRATNPDEIMAEIARHIIGAHPAATIELSEEVIGYYRDLSASFQIDHMEDGDWSPTREGDT